MFIFLFHSFMNHRKGRMGRKLLIILISNYLINKGLNAAYLFLNLFQI